MINIRPVSDLRYKFTEIESAVNEGEPVYLTKNGHGTMVVMSLDTYAKLTDPVESALNEADYLAENNSQRMTHGEVFQALRKRNEK